MLCNRSADTSGHAIASCSRSAAATPAAAAPRPGFPEALVIAQGLGGERGDLSDGQNVSAHSHGSPGIAMRLSNRRIAKPLRISRVRPRMQLSSSCRRRLQCPALPSDPGPTVQADGCVGEWHEAKLLRLHCQRQRRGRICSRLRPASTMARFELTLLAHQLRIGGELCDFRQAERGDAAIQDEAAACELRPFQRSFFSPADDRPGRRNPAARKQRFESQLRGAGWVSTQSPISTTPFSTASTIAEESMSRR